jgi:hypothetical protein
MLLDHVVLFVDDLEDAVDTFSQHGFTVTPGGVNGPTHNALIAFANETYIELIALQSRKKRLLLRLLGQLGLLKVLSPKNRNLNTRLLSWFSGSQGFTDICLRVVSLEAFASTPPEALGALTPVTAFKRHRPDGIHVSWRLAGAVDLMQPFFIEDDTPLNYRIPDGPSRHHANGSQGITELITRSELSVRPENAIIRTSVASSRSKFSIGITTTGLVKEIPLGREYNADIRLIN